MTTAEEETQRIRSYLTSQASRLSVAELVQKLRADTAPLEAIGAAVPVAHFADRGLTVRASAHGRCALMRLRKRRRQGDDIG